VGIQEQRTKERGLWKPEFGPLRSTSRLVKDGTETEGAFFFRKVRVSHGRGEIVCQLRVTTGPES
jgi:hypothetical protein